MVALKIQGAPGGGGAMGKDKEPEVTRLPDDERLAPEAARRRQLAGWFAAYAGKRKHGKRKRKKGGNKGR
jgi:hypothetical protein